MAEPSVVDQVDTQQLRAALSRFTTGVVVVTAHTPQGHATGMTANSFTSVSLSPPLVLFCVNRDSRMAEVFAGADAFAINVLRDRDKEISRRFARQGLDRFGDHSPRSGVTGAPLLADPLAVIECVRPRLVAAGDHDIVIGQVVRVAADDSAQAAPLVYYGGAYRDLDPDPGDWWTAFL